MTEAEKKPGAGGGVVVAPGAGPLAAPIAAILSSLATLACCLPAGFLAAAGAAGTSILFQRARPAIMTLSVVFLLLGFVQQRRSARCGLKPSSWNVALLWLATVIVFVVLLFPQEIAGFFADRIGPGAR